VIALHAKIRLFKHRKPSGRLGLSALATVSLIEKTHIDSLKIFFREASKKGNRCMSQIFKF